MEKTSIGDRMKNNYESRFQTHLVRRMPVILRLDGKAFHTFTRQMQCKKPFDENFIASMVLTSLYLVNNIQGAKCVYTQSDEISILLTDYEIFETEAWFDNNIQKMVSISAAMATAYFNFEYMLPKEIVVSVEKLPFALFDSRAFNIPKEEVNNYFVWRQQDWIRNSVNMLAQHNFSHKSLQGLNVDDVKKMLVSEKNIIWENLPNYLKFGVFITRNFNDFKDRNLETLSTPIFQTNPEKINNLIG